MTAPYPLGSFPFRLRSRTAVAGSAPAVAPPAGLAPADADPGVLLRRAGRGDRAAFARLYDGTVALVHARSLEVAPSGAEAATLAVFLEIWQRAPQWRGARDGLSWMLVVAEEVLQRLAAAALAVVERPDALREVGEKQPDVA